MEEEEEGGRGEEEDDDDEEEEETHGKRKLTLDVTWSFFRSYPQAQSHSPSAREESEERLQPVKHEQREENVESWAWRVHVNKIKEAVDETNNSWERKLKEGETYEKEFKNLNLENWREFDNV